jgi:hypothetical protein
VDSYVDYCLHQNNVTCIKRCAHQRNTPEDKVIRGVGSDKEELDKQDNPRSKSDKEGVG